MIRDAELDLCNCVLVTDLWLLSRGNYKKLTSVFQKIKLKNQCDDRRMNFVVLV